jgi:hypothetical protein
MHLIRNFTMIYSNLVPWGQGYSIGHIGALFVKMVKIYANFSWQIQNHSKNVSSKSEYRCEFERFIFRELSGSPFWVVFEAKIEKILVKFSIFNA